MDAQSWTVEEARKRLAAWGRWHASRDKIVRAGVAAGVSKAEAARLTGLSRTTIDSITEGEQ